MSYGAFTTANYLSTASTPVTAVPLTLACWFRSTSSTAAQALITITDTTDATHYFRLMAAGATAGDPVQAAASATTGGAAVSSTGYSTNVWTAAAGVFTSAASRAAFINGGSKGTNATSRTPLSVDSIKLGHSLDSSEAPQQPLLGLLAGAAIWNAALTDAEVAGHAKGVSPLLIRPQSLVFYAPLIRGLQDIRAGLTITMTGTVAVDVHPRIYGL